MNLQRKNSLWLAYYGDDFTGATDVLESLARAGIRTVLFLAPPTRAQLAKFPQLQAFGVAGGSRTLTPAQMQCELPRAFRSLKRSGAAIVHYKTCSTFDSSPQVGSIGMAIELGRKVFGKVPTPLVLGVPTLGRYVVFGNLFARSGLDSEPIRLDRHPTMSRHPVTPMDEADIRLHLSRQTKLPIELVDVLQLRAAAEDSSPPSRAATPQLPPIRLFDTLDESDLLAIGRRLDAGVRPGCQSFCVGSSGIEYALVAHWRKCGWIAPSTSSGKGTRKGLPAISAQVIAVSGSCSPVTDRQIRWAQRAGYVAIPCKSNLLADARSALLGVDHALAQAQSALQAGKHVIFHTALGPADRRRKAFELVAKTQPGRTKVEKMAAAAANLGQGLAMILLKAMQQTRARRIVVCGGDTSTSVARALGVEVLEFLAPVAPGGPLCRIHSSNQMVHGCEVVFKGGQVGRDSFFLDLTQRTASCSQ